MAACLWGLRGDSTTRCDVCDALVCPTLVASRETVEEREERREERASPF